MRGAFPIRVAAVAIVLICSGSSEALAAGKAWVSSGGSDTTGCGARSAPCATFQYAHDQFDASGGEIDVVDRGSYGGLNITKPLQIISPGALAFIRGAGVSIADGADVVIDGVNISNNSDGVSLLGSGKITIRNSHISDSTRGGLFLYSGNGASTINVETSVFERSGTGVLVVGFGSGSVQVNISKSSFSDMGLSFLGGAGISLQSNEASHISATLISNRIFHCRAGFDTFTPGSSSSISANVSDSIISHSLAIGLNVGYSATIQLNGTRIFEQTTDAIDNKGDIQTISNNNRVIGGRRGNAIRVVSGN